MVGPPGTGKTMVNHVTLNEVMVFIMIGYGLA